MTDRPDADGRELRGALFYPCIGDSRTGLLDMRVAGPMAYHLAHAHLERNYPGRYRNGETAVVPVTKGVES